MKRLRDVIDRYPLVTYFTLACAFSRSLWLLMIASARRWLPFYFPTNWLGNVGIFGPSLAAVAVANHGQLSRQGKPPASIGSPQFRPR